MTETTHEAPSMDLFYYLPRVTSERVAVKFDANDRIIFVCMEDDLTVDMDYDATGTTTCLAFMGWRVSLWIDID